MTTKFPQISWGKEKYSNPETMGTFQTQTVAMGCKWQIGELYNCGTQLISHFKTSVYIPLHNGSLPQENLG